MGNAVYIKYNVFLKFTSLSIALKDLEHFEVLPKFKYSLLALPLVHLSQNNLALTCTLKVFLMI